MSMSDSEKEARCRQILRTVTSEALQATPAQLWIYPDAAQQAEAVPAAKAPAKGAAAAEEPPPPLEAEDDPEAGGLFLSHVWGEPDCWAPLFGVGQYNVAKQLQVTASLQRGAKEILPGHRGDLVPRDRDPRVWVDCASLPDAVVPFDHPLEELTLGTYAMPVKDLKALLPKVALTEGYTILHLEDGHRFEGTMNFREWDETGRPMEKTIPQPVEWEIPPGWYHVRSAEVIPEDRMSPQEAGKKNKLRPFAEQMRTWCNGLCLRDEVWVEFTLGSIRAECMLLSETMLALHGGLLAAVTWNYFDRLWPFVEWTVYCARRGPDRIQLASDHFVGAALVEYQRAIRRLSVLNAGVRDPRDRELLLGMLKRIFKCDTMIVTDGFVKPKGGRLIEATKVPITDYSAVERYARVTAIAVFAKEAADVANRKPTAGDEGGWAALAGELGYLDLQAALKLSKPFDWEELSALKPGGERSARVPSELSAEEREAAFYAFMEEWWTGKVLPVLEDERKLAMR